MTGVQTCALPICTALTSVHPKATDPFYIENAPEFLDKPGEFYFNKDNKELFYYPEAYEDMAMVKCYVPRTDVLMTVNGESKEKKARNIIFEGIQFQYAGWEEPTKKGFSTVQAEQLAVTPEDSESMFGNQHSKLVPANVKVNFAYNVSFKNNKFIHLGSVAISYNKASEHSVISGNLFDDISCSAITLGDWTIKKGDPLENYVRRLQFTNNLIRRTAVEYLTPIITAYYVNNVKISHNDIKDAPYTGISLGWGWGEGIDNCTYNTISDNRIENVLYRLFDGAHIYTIDTQKETVISGNHLIKTNDWTGGIYHDNASAFITTRDNVFEDVYKWLKISYFNIHDNVAYNNYCENPNVVLYPEVNKIEDAIGKTNGVWPTAAQAIIANAGLSGEYKSMYDDYNAKKNLKNVMLELPKYQNAPGVYIPAGDLLLEGGEGVAYHDNALGNTGGMMKKGEPYKVIAWNGTNHKYVMVTAQGEWTKHLAEIPETGQYELYLDLTVVQQGTAVSVWIDGEQVADKVTLPPNCEQYEKFSDNKIKLL